MRFMIMLRMAEETGPPPAALDEMMGKQMGELFRSGVMLDAGGLLAGDSAARVRLSGGRVTVLDGPFTEAKELVGGYAVVRVESRQQAVDLGTELIRIHKDHWPGWEGAAEIRQLAEGPAETAS